MGGELDCDVTSHQDDGMSTNPNSNVASEEKKSQIPSIITAYTTRIRIISRCAQEYIALAQKTSQEWSNSYFEQLDQCSKSLEIFKNRESLTEEDRTQLASIIVLIAHPKNKGDFQYHVEHSHSKILSQSLLIFAFSAFDAFVGVLINQLCQEERRLIYKLDEKEVKIHDLLGCNSIKEVLDKIIERDISSLLRNNYDEIFTALARRHELATLKNFPNWTSFIEASQRRNLITHCGGKVNVQYIEACKQSGMQLGAKIVPGYQLKVGLEYLQATLDILYEVGVKLGYTLWHKAIPDRAEESEMSLGLGLYELLVREEWHLAKIIGKFAIDLPGRKCDLHGRIARINYAQALKWSGDNACAMKIIDGADWSSCIRDLRLGVEVLKGNFCEAVSLMKAIGKNGEIVDQPGYHQWPLFREFRTTEEFKLAYESVYGTPFVADSENQSPINISRQEQLTEQGLLCSIQETGEGTMSPMPLSEIIEAKEPDADSDSPGTEQVDS
jgi:hypothetical protein